VNPRRGISTLLEYRGLFDAGHVRVMMPLASEARLEGRSVFVGRTAELRQLTAALDALFSRRGSLALVGGDAGAGKTALVEKLATTARQRGIEVLWGRCWESGDTPPYWAWVQVLRRHLRARSPGAWAGPGESYLRYLPQILPELPGSSVAPGDLQQPDQHTRLALFDEVTVLLQPTCRPFPSCNSLPGCCPVAG